ncbi:MAG: hypothetical protein AB2L12_07670 [Smithellaceae bacterium]
METIFQDMADKWSSAWVSRTEIEHFTGGIIKEKYCANLDSAGKGCPGRVRIGRKIAYPVGEFVRWLEGRSVAIPDRHQAKECVEGER